MLRFDREPVVSGAGLAPGPVNSPESAVFSRVAGLDRAAIFFFSVASDLIDNSVPAESLAVDVVDFATVGLDG